MEFDHIIYAYDNGGDNGRLGKEIEEAIERTPTNLKEDLWARLPNVPKSLKSCNVGLKFQLKMLEFMDSMNKKCK